MEKVIEDGRLIRVDADGHITLGASADAKSRVRRNAWADYPSKLSCSSLTDHAKVIHSIVHNSHLADWADVRYSNLSNVTLGGSVYVYDSIVENVRLKDHLAIKGGRITKQEHVAYFEFFSNSNYVATLYPHVSGKPYVMAGCWGGSLDEFEAMIRSDVWVESDYKIQELRRPEILAGIEFFKARAATWELD